MAFLFSRAYLKTSYKACRMIAENNKKTNVNPSSVKNTRKYNKYIIISNTN